jgi:phenylacetate-coenzyme A ligase PaaK-like adenylate-forming protein
MARPPEVRQMFEPDAEAMPPDQRGQLQLARLRALVDRLLSLDGVQAGRLRAAGVQAGGDLTTLGDLPRLPVTAKSDLWEAYPFGMVGVPAADVVAVHGSSGTGGRPTLVAYTRADLALWARMCAGRWRPPGRRGTAWCTTPTATGCSPAGSASTTGRSSWARPWCPPRAG